MLAALAIAIAIAVAAAARRRRIALPAGRLAAVLAAYPVLGDVEGVVGQLDRELKEALPRVKRVFVEAEPMVRGPAQARPPAPAGD